MMIVVAVQLIAGHVLGFGGAMAIGAGHGWELLIFVIGNTVGVWGGVRWPIGYEGNGMWPH